MRNTTGAVLLLLVCVCSCFAVGTGEEKWGLFLEDEGEIIKHLADHNIPDIPMGGVGGPTGNPREVRRAVELFQTGSPALRLAIAQSLLPFPNCVDSTSAREFWQACGPDDYEAKHYLVGVLLACADADQRRDVREWLYREAHPSYAVALSTHLPWSAERWYDGPRDAEADERLLPLLRELYRQTGSVTVVKNIDPRIRAPRSTSVQYRVVALLPPTRACCDLLIEWIVADSKKVDAATLEAMWHSWQDMRRPGVLEGEYLDSALTRRAVAESWLLSPYHPRQTVGDEGSNWNRSVASQIYNPDGRVRKAAIEALLKGKIPMIIEDLPAQPPPMVRQALADTEEVYRGIEEGTGNLELARRYGQMLESLRKAEEGRESTEEK